MPAAAMAPWREPGREPSMSNELEEALLEPTAEKPWTFWKRRATSGGGVIDEVARKPCCCAGGLFAPGFGDGGNIIIAFRLFCDGNCC